MPAQVLREAVEADVVGLTLRPRRAEGQAVVVLLHLLHLQHSAVRMREHNIIDTASVRGSEMLHGFRGETLSQAEAHP